MEAVVTIISKHGLTIKCIKEIILIRLSQYCIAITFVLRVI